LVTIRFVRPKTVHMNVRLGYVRLDWVRLGNNQAVGLLVTIRFARP
jgi:hypothetical protein